MGLYGWTRMCLISARVPTASNTAGAVRSTVIRVQAHAVLLICWMFKYAHSTVKDAIPCLSTYSDSFCFRCHLAFRFLGALFDIVFESFNTRMLGFECEIFPNNWVRCLFVSRRLSFNKPVSWNFNDKTTKWYSSRGRYISKHKNELILYFEDVGYVYARSTL